MVRDAIARHGAAAQPFTAVDALALPAEASAKAAKRADAAFIQFPTLRSGDDQGACVIEPSVRCNHCGYCLSYGH